MNQGRFPKHCNQHDTFCPSPQPLAGNIQGQQLTLHHKSEAQLHVK